MSDKTSDKLLPCPFCGSDAILEISKFGCRVSCEQRAQCGATQVFSDSEEEAMAAWNTRKPMERIVERLEDNSEWTDSTFDEDGYCNDDSEEVVELSKAIEIVKEEM